MMRIMMKMPRTIVAITIILTNISLSYGQKLTGMGYNHAIVNAIGSGDKSFLKGTVDSIDFVSDFFDDFSDYYYSVFPRNNHWADRSAYINSTYPDSMISLGVATLDAFNTMGYPYYSTDSLGPVHSDTLTSQPFHFVNTLSGTYYFSFFYQAGGKGDPPEGIINDNPDEEGSDSLILEFYSVTDNKWNFIYSTLDNTDPQLFKQVVFPIDTGYLADGFRFRFRNYTSLPSNYQQGQDPGKFSNADQWHIDYIQIKKAASETEMTTLKDITIVKPLLPTLTEYNSVPWRHLTQAQTTITNRIMPLTMRNFDANNGANLSVNRIFKGYNLTTGASILNRTMTNYIDPNTQLTFNDSLISGITYSDTDIGRFEIIAHIKPTIDIDQPSVNDTVKRMEVYYDQYAYDDGSAEMGMGVGGEYEENARIAQRYRIFRNKNNPDTLRAVLIYFCKSVDSATANYSYSISIRKNDKLIPSNTVLYTSDTLTPDYSVHLNEFTRIEIDPPILLSDTFFIVVNQISGYINIGYDIDYNNLDKLMVYTKQTWSNPESITKGSLMIRPSFGKSSLPTETVSDKEVMQKLLVYPNPVSDVLNFIVPDGHGNNTVQIYNSTGSIVLSSLQADSPVPVSSFRPGVYFIVITSSDGQYRQTAKFIKE
jgi:hypothetical protein